MQGNNQSAIDFLKKWNKEGPWVLTSIRTDRKGINTSTFTANQEQDLISWLNEYNGKRNIYFHVNSVLNSMTSKAMKEDIKSGDWLHIDIDPHKGQNIEDERERLLGLLTDGIPKGIPKPTVIIFSGGGYQGFWKLKNPVVIDGDVSVAQDFELYNKRLEQVFGGDHCHNVDRIMRLPGTVNIPDAKKKKAGRVEQLALLLEFNNKSYNIDDFKKAQGVQIASGGVSSQTGGNGYKVKISGNIERIGDLSELDEWGVTDRVKIIIAQGRHPDQPKEGDNSRSAWLFDCICQLYRHGVPDDIIFSLLTDEDWQISESVRESKNPEKYLIRQMTRAKEHSDDPNLSLMNGRHAIIGNIGGKCRVIEEIQDDVMNRSRLTISSFEDLRNRYSHMKVDMGTDANGKPIQVPLGKYWLAHPKRRQFDYMRFMPLGNKDGVYNLWQGFSVEPKPGDCSLFLYHLEHVVCSGNKEYYQYLIKWMARAVQKPASQGEVAIVLRGSKGTGKGYVARTFGSLFGRHHMHVANAKHLVGQFNAHLRDCVSLFADEAFFAGDKQHESVLKMLVTEDSIPIEAKGVDVEAYPNYVHLIMAANDPHVVRASGDERRYFVVNMSDEYKQNADYFGKMKKQLDEGGLEALLFHLQDIDLSDFQVRNVPQTDALAEQKLLSLSTEEEWWYRKLQDGHLLDDQSEWTSQVECDYLITDFTKYAEKWKHNRRGNETSLGRFITRVCPHVERKQKRVPVEERDPHTNRVMILKKRVYFYEFGSLKKCRETWEQLHGKIKWEKPLEGNSEAKPLKQPF